VIRDCRTRHFYSLPLVTLALAPRITQVLGASSAAKGRTARQVALRFAIETTGRCNGEQRLTLVR